MRKIKKNNNNNNMGKQKLHFYTVVGDFTNTVKTTFSFNIDLYLAFKQYGNTNSWKQRNFLYLLVTL